MWKRRTEEEIAEVERQVRRKRKWVAALVGALSAGMLPFIQGRRQPSLSWDEVSARLPFALPVGVISGLFYYIKLSLKRTVICPHCGKSKPEDDVTRCACGEDFVDIKTVKWVP